MKWIAGVVLLIIPLLIANSVLAHISGVSVFKINGVNTKIAPKDFSHPKLKIIPPDSDLGSKHYSAGEELSFELDLSKFITPQSIFDKTDFIWDFGDGTPKQTITNGSKNTHIYNQDGTYLLTIYADYTPAGFGNSIPEPQLLQSVVIDIGQVQETSNINPSFGAIFLLGIGVLLILWFIKKIIWRKKRSQKH